jgi:hypothetical protein
MDLNSFDHIAFGQSVKLQSISIYNYFAQFTLYNIISLWFQVKPLIWVEAQVERHSRSRVEIMVKARSQFKERR